MSTQSAYTYPTIAANEARRLIATEPINPLTNTTVICTNPDAAPGHRKHCVVFTYEDGFIHHFDGAHWFSDYPAIEFTNQLETQS